MKHLIYVVIIFLCFSAKAQQTDYVDFLKADATIGFNVKEKKVIGLVTYTFKALKAVDSVYIDAKSITINSVFNDYGPVEHAYNNKIIVLKEAFKQDKTYIISIDYTAQPKKALYFVNRANDYQIWTQGQGKYTSNWLPSIDDTNDKIEFDISLFYDKDYKAISNGKQLVKTDHGPDTVVKFDMKQPMSSYLVALVIGKYNKTIETSKTGIPLELYYYPEDSAKVEPTYRYTKQMFDFLEEEIGVPYPWQNYKQVPVHDFLYSGMENTSCTIFSDAFMVDETAFVDKNYVNVNAHELAHQWFGNLVTAKSGEHHWLQEGFATYYALLAEREIFGDDYYYWRLYEYLQELKIQDDAGLSTALLNPKSSSTTFYKKGAWALHKLREEIGDDIFKTSVKNYLEKHKFKNADSYDFVREVEQVSGLSLSKFVDNWLASDSLFVYDMLLSLKKNEMASFLITHESNPYLSYRTDENDEYIPSSLTHELPKGFYPIRVAVLNEALAKSNYPTYSSLVKEGYESKNIQLRQAIAQNTEKIPTEFKNDFESLLKDKSYATIESALYVLWMNYPKERKKYLEETRDIHGFNDKNIRTLWILLALNTEGFTTIEKQNFYTELVDYTSPKQHFELRQNAFSILATIDAFNTQSIENLIKATTHHNWRFKKMAKDLLEKLSEDEKYKQLVAQLTKQLKTN